MINMYKLVMSNVVIFHVTLKLNVKSFYSVVDNENVRLVH